MFYVLWFISVFVCVFILMGFMPEINVYAMLWSPYYKKDMKSQLKYSAETSHQTNYWCAGIKLR